MNKEDAKKLLYTAGVFYDDIDDDDWDEHLDGKKQTLNMNDTFGWATAFGEYVPDEKLPEVARLFKWYGLCGLHYWVSEQYEGMESEFFDVTRGIQFVRHEESLLNKIPDSNQRAYTNIKYTLGKSHIAVFFRDMRMRLFWMKIACRKLVARYKR